MSFEKSGPSFFSRKNRNAMFFFTVVFLIGASARAGELLKLELHRVLPVEGPKNNQPSGLCLYKGNLYTVSDKHDNRIFRIDPGEKSARMVPALTFSPPGKTYLDLEGVTCDERGNFYLASEKTCRIIRVSQNAATAVFLTPDLKPTGRTKGLFKVGNAMLEGITRAGPETFTLCAERQPRGILRVRLTKEGVRSDAFTCNRSRFMFPEKTSPDFSGLCMFRGRHYVLQRNARLISELGISKKGVREGEGWSYSHIVHRLSYRYAVIRYGMAEGLCMDDRFVYVILDNNNIPRLRYPKDRRPLLLIMKNPLAGKKDRGDAEKDSGKKGEAGE